MAFLKVIKTEEFYVDGHDSDKRLDVGFYHRKEFSNGSFLWYANLKTLRVADDYHSKILEELYYSYNNE